MNIKVITNDIKDIIEEVVFFNKRSRDKYRLIRYANNVRHIELSAIANDKHVNLVLDVGANEGQFAESIRQVGFRHEIVSFEPIPSVFSILNKKVQRDPKWRAFNFAVGSENKLQTFNVYADSKLSSFLQGDGSHTSRFKDNFDTPKQVEVEIKRLDSIWSQTVSPLKPKQIFLKLDTQGFDLEAFKGLGNVNDSIKYVLTEMSVIPLYKGMPTYTEALDFFATSGYGPVSLIPVTRNHSDGRVIEFDCLLRKMS